MTYNKRQPFTEEWQKYEKGKEYNRSIGLYGEVDTNERFYRGDQWVGVASSGLPTPVFNFYRRVIDYYVSALSASAVTMSYAYASPVPRLTPEQQNRVNGVLQKITAFRWEKLKMDRLLTDSLFDAAITGDAFAYTYWDPSVRTGQPYTGDFRTVLTDNTNVFFGNPNSRAVQSQPYIIISMREPVCDLRAEAEKNGIDKERIALIVPDSDTEYFSGDMAEKELENTKCVSLIYLWKEDGRVHYRKSVRGTVITDDTDTGLSLYPVAYYSWSKVKNSWHGRAVGTGMVDNQIFINKAYAMVMKHMMDTAFSKVVYDSTVIDEWTNRVGEAIAVNGPVENVARVLSGGSMQSGMLDVINMAIGHTKDFLGATDSALGTEKADNTSAIIALQQASSQPLENVRRSLYQFVEDIGLIWLDFMFAFYDDKRLMRVQSESGSDFIEVPFSESRSALFDCAVEVGDTGWWSEVTAVNTLDGLLKLGKISATQYLERLPENIIPRKKELIESLSQTEEK